MIRPNTGRIRRHRLSGPAGESMPEDAALVDVRDLHCAFAEGGRTHTVLDALSLTVRRGETVALVGRSGSGKSTALNLIAGLATPDGGVVRVEGVDVHALTERERTLLRRRRIGFVYQFFNLIETLSVRDNVMLPLELDRRASRGDREQADALLAEVGLADRAGSFPDRLSGGEQQRVALVRALVHEPALILADEPTGNLDGETGAGVLDLLERLVQRSGGGMILVTHSAEVAARAQRVLTLRDGRLAA